MSTQRFDHLHGFVVLPQQLRFPIETGEMSEENRTVASGHEVIRQGIAKGRSEGEEKNQVEKNRRHRAIEALVEAAQRVIDEQRSPTDEELNDDHDEQFQSFASMSIDTKDARLTAMAVRARRIGLVSRGARTSALSKARRLIDVLRPRRIQSQIARGFLSFLFDQRGMVDLRLARLVLMIVGQSAGTCLHQRTTSQRRSRRVRDRLTLCKKTSIGERRTDTTLTMEGTHLHRRVVLVHLADDQGVKNGHDHDREKKVEDYKREMNENEEEGLSYCLK